MKYQVILLNGPSSSGKSTLSRNIQTILSDYEIISIDDFMKIGEDETIYEDDVYDISGDMCEATLEHLKRGKGVIIDHVITSQMEHNAVTRPLAYLEDAGVMVTKVKTDPVSGADPDEIRKSIFRCNTVYYKDTPATLGRGEFFVIKTDYSAASSVASSAGASSFTGASFVCLMERLTRFASRSTPISLTSTSSPTLSTVLGSSTLSQAISEM